MFTSLRFFFIIKNRILKRKNDRLQKQQNITNIPEGENFHMLHIISHLHLFSLLADFVLSLVTTFSTNLVLVSW